jgi:hypothetical protein
MIAHHAVEGALAPLLLVGVDDDGDPLDGRAPEVAVLAELDDANEP